MIVDNKLYVTLSYILLSYFLDSIIIYACFEYRKLCEEIIYFNVEKNNLHIKK